jgi:hypothetical protein
MVLTLCCSASRTGSATVTSPRHQVHQFPNQFWTSLESTHARNLRCRSGKPSRSSTTAPRALPSVTRCSRYLSNATILQRLVSSPISSHPTSTSAPSITSLSSLLICESAVRVCPPKRNRRWTPTLNGKKHWLQRNGTDRGFLKATVKTSLFQQRTSISKRMLIFIIHVAELADKVFPGGLTNYLVWRNVHLTR